MTDKMNDLLEDLAMSRTKRVKPVNKSGLIREAVRLCLDEQAFTLVINLNPDLMVFVPQTPREPFTRDVSH